MGKKKVETRSFHLSKGKKTDKRIKPLKGEPNTNLDTYGKEDGRLRNRRKFGKDGNAIKDYDIADKHKPYDHVHDFKGKEREKKDREPNKKERREIKKAKKKRRFWIW